MTDESNRHGHGHFGCQTRGPIRSNFGPVQEGDCATFSAVSDTRCSTYLVFTIFLTAECSTVELPGNS